MIRRVLEPARLSSAILIVSFVAMAAPTAADEARGTELAQEAFDLSRQGDAEAAITKYEEALAIAPDLHGARFAMARIFAGLSRFEEAHEQFVQLVAANPEDGAARRGEVTALLFLGRWQEARKRLEEGLVALPRDGQLAHLLARVLASAPDDTVRDGRIALELAVRVYDVKRIPTVAETVAMAFAANGEFDKASRMQGKIVRDAEAAGGDPQLEAKKARLAAYDRGEAWRAQSPVEVVQSTELPSGS